MARAHPFIGSEGPGASLLTIGDLNLVTSSSDVRFALLGGRFVGEATLLKILCTTLHYGTIYCHDFYGSSFLENQKRWRNIRSIINGIDTIKCINYY